MINYAFSLTISHVSCAVRKRTFCDQIWKLWFFHCLKMTFMNLSMECIKFPDFSMTFTPKNNFPWPFSKFPDFSMIWKKNQFSLTFPDLWEPWVCFTMRSLIPCARNQHFFMRTIKTECTSAQRVYHSVNSCILLAHALVCGGHQRHNGFTTLSIHAYCWPMH